MNYKKIIVVIIVSLCFFSCKDGKDLLDPVETNDKNSESVFTDSLSTLQFLNNIYKDLAFNWEYKRYTNTSTGNTDATDDAVSKTENAGYLRPLVDGSLSAALESPYTTGWSVPYSNIRKVNLFLFHIQKSKMHPSTIKRVVAEARFLRAWYYANLVRYFGGIIIMEDKMINPESEFHEKRSSYEECINYIVSELDAASKDLPINYNTQANEFGRITKGAAFALKARVLLYAASPLFNGGNIAAELGGTPEQITLAGYENYKSERWKVALDAAREVINLNEYSLYYDQNAESEPPGFSFSRMFLNRKNTEYILQYNLPNNKEMESYFLPVSRGGTFRSMPTHNLAEEFGMINGKRTFEQNSGYNPQKPFENRDPRFNYTIIFNGTPWLFQASGAKTPIYTFTGIGSTQDGFSNGVHTGYFWRKMMDENVNSVSGGNTNRCLPLIRFAEILMIYAEASNELSDTEGAYNVLKSIRKRAGIAAGEDGLYGLKPNMNKEEMRKAIFHERRVEFAFEEQRFWDVRRWKIASTIYDNLVLTACKITRKSSANLIDFNYEILPIKHAQNVIKFKPHNYLYPIGQTEINKNLKIIQNVGY